MKHNGVKIFLKSERALSWRKVKVEKLLKDVMDSILSPSPTVKIQIMDGKVCLSPCYIHFKTKVFKFTGMTILSHLYPTLIRPFCYMFIIFAIGSHQTTS